MTRTKSIRPILFCLTLLVLTSGLLSAQVPDHPSKLVFKPLVYDPPRPGDHRVALENGMILYIVEDHRLPTLDISALIRTGSLYDPKDKKGLASMAGSVMRTGGTEKISGDDLDERLDFLGGSISTRIGSTSGRADLSVLIKDVDEGLGLFADVLMHPVFEAEKIKLYKDGALASLKNKNDSPRTVLEREFDKLLYGDHPLVWEETQATIEGITRQDLLDFHEKYFAPDNIILAVAGDFDRAEMVRKIEAAFAGWPRKKVVLPEIPEVVPQNRPGLFMVQKEISQGYINMGHFGIKDTNPDRFAIDIMNFILGGGSFTSRITTKVRSDEGLAYNTGSRFDERHLFPGTFYGYVQTQSPTAAYAVSLILEEFKRIREEPVSVEEMETAKNYYLDSFPNRFSSTDATMEEFARLEYDGFPPDYFETYRDRIRSVTREDVLRVAREYIKPGELTYLIVGDIEACEAGSEEHAAALEDFGNLTVIELKDPLTGE